MLFGKVPNRSFIPEAVDSAELQIPFRLPSVVDLGSRLPLGQINLWKFELKSGYHAVPMHESTLGLVLW